MSNFKDINVTPRYPVGGGVIVNGSTNSGYSGSVSVDLPSEKISSAKIGVSNDRGNLNVEHDFNGNKSTVSLSVNI